MVSIMARIEDSIPTIEIIFEQWREVLGADYRAYRNHVYRVVHFCMVFFNGNTEDKEKIAIAGCFHDMGIWANKTFDYLDHSANLAKTYLKNNGKEEWCMEIELMIQFHHKITSYRNKKYSLVEIFRKADWIDVTKGNRSFGLPKDEVKAIVDSFPYNGFHEKLLKLTKAEFKNNPFRPLPMLKW